MTILSNINLIQFSQPFWLYIFTAISIIILISKNISVLSLLKTLKYEYIFKHTNYDDIQKIATSNTQPYKSKYIIITKLYYLLILGLLCTSLADPFYTGEKLPDPPSNRDVIFLVDNEVSMVLKDYFIDKKRVERLTMVKSVLLNFANKLAGNRISIVTFSEEAHTLLPFTTDTNLIKYMIPRIEETLTGRTSNPQKALLYTLNYLNNISSSNSSIKPTIVLITDVLRPPRDIDPNIVAKYLKLKEYPLYVIAIGASSYKAEDIASSQLIYHPASFQRLKDIAHHADGQFYWAKNTESLSGVINQILKSKKRKVDLQPEFIEIPLFQWPLILALSLLLLQYFSSLISFRRIHA